MQLSTSRTSAKQIWRFFVHDFFFRSKARWRVANSFPIRPTQVCFLCEIKKGRKVEKTKEAYSFYSRQSFFSKKLAKYTQKKTEKAKCFLCRFEMTC